MRKRLMSALIVLQCLIAITVPAYSKNISDMQKELNKASSQKKKVESELKEIKNEKQSALENKKIIDNELKEAQDNYENAVKLLGECEQRIKEKEKELEEIEKKESEQFKLLKLRARAMYEEGNTGYIEVLLNSKSFSDFLSRMEIIKRIVSHDKSILEELKKSKEEVQKAKELIDKEKRDRERIKNQADVEKAEMEKKQAAQIEFIEKLSKDEKELRKAYEAAEAAEKQLQKEISEELKRIQQQNNRKYSGGSLGWPLPGKTTISSYFENRFHPVLKTWKKHTGIDIPAATGTSVEAANSGTVIRAGWNDAYGNYIIIDHGGGIATLYGHNSKLLVSAGDEVQKGQVIAKVGSTGYSTGPHLHFEVMVNGEPVNPLNYTSPY